MPHRCEKGAWQRPDEGCTVTGVTGAGQLFAANSHVTATEANKLREGTRSTDNSL